LIHGREFLIPSLAGDIDLFVELDQLPVERNASSRALNLLESSRLAQSNDLRGVRKVLRSAAFTYMAGVGQRLANFVFFAVVILASQGIPAT
jgi:Zn-dependent membrane protease YugP